MAPRNTKHGASASAGRTSSRSPRASASPRKKSSSTTTRRSTASKRASKPATRRPKSARATQAATPLNRWVAFAVVTISAVALFIWMYYPAVAVQYRETREKARLAAELKTLQARNERLRKQVDRLKTPAGVEDYARSQLGLVKKGENVVVVVDGNEAEEASQAIGTPEIDSDETTVAPQGTWTAFLDLVFGVQ